MEGFICPVCKSPLVACAKAYMCPMGHNFDISRKGYVNLLMSQNSKHKQHGDDKDMVRARRDFLSRGYYSGLLDALLGSTTAYAPDCPVILDAGCGEGWYTDAICSHLEEIGRRPMVFGIDISKNALELNQNHSSRLALAVASVFNLPMACASCDMVFNIFAPYSHEEFLRVLKKGGILIRVIPLENHLFALKKAIYQNPYKNNPEDVSLEGYDVLECREVKSAITPESNCDIKNLFTMTPYYYKTAACDIKKLDAITDLTVEIEFGILIYKKK